MISKKTYVGDGATTRFLSDFIIRDEQFTRPYAYIYDATLNPDGTEDQLENGSVDQIDWSWPDNIWKRGVEIPSSNDLVPTDKWQVVDNSILFYVAPNADTNLWLEVATTSEEFGTTLTQPSVERSEAASDASQAAQDAAELAELAAQGAQAAAEAAQIAADAASGAAEADAEMARKWAEELEDVEVTLGHYSSLHHSAKSAASASASEVSRQASEVAQTAAEAAQLASETAQGLSEAAALAASTSETNSAASAAASETSRLASEAAASAASASESAAAASASAASLSAASAQTIVDNYTAITVEDNAIDFSVSNHFELTATAANITALGLTGLVGQSGTIIMHSAENVTGWGVEFKFKTVPTDLIGDEVFGYFIEDATNIWIGRVQ